MNRPSFTGRNGERQSRDLTAVPDLSRELGALLAETHFVPKLLDHQAVYLRLFEAIDRRDGGLFEAVVHNCTADQLKRLAHDHRLLNRINLGIQRLVRMSQGPDCRDSVRQAAWIAEAALAAGIDFEIPRGRVTTIETLLVLLHKRDLFSRAVNLTHWSLRSGHRLRPAIALTSIALGSVHARDGADLEALTGLCLEVLQAHARGQLRLPVDKAGAVMDVVLAACGEPGVPVWGRSRLPLYERDALDAAPRIMLAGEIGLAVMAAGLPFDTDRNRERINLLIRAMAGSAAALTCIVWCIQEGWGPDGVRAAERFFQLEAGAAELKRSAAEVNLDQTLATAQALAARALELANRSLESDPQDPARVIERYRLQGATINGLLRAAAHSGLLGDSVAGAGLSGLVEKVFAVRRIADKLHSDPLAAAIQALLEAGGVDARYNALRLAELARRHQFGLPSDLRQAAARAVQAEQGRLRELLDVMQSEDAPQTRSRATDLRRDLDGVDAACVFVASPETGRARTFSGRQPGSGGALLGGLDTRRPSNRKGR